MGVLAIIACVAVRPTAIANVTVSAVGATWLELAWRTSAENVTGFAYELVTVANGSQRLTTIDEHATRHRVDALAAGQTYTVRMRTVNECAHSAWRSVRAQTKPAADDQGTRDARPLMTHEAVLIAVMLVLWLCVLRYFYRTFARVTFVNDKQYGSYARPYADYDEFGKVTTLKKVSVIRVCV